MEIKYINSENCQLILKNAEARSIVKVLKFTLIDLEWEYSIRTGFNEAETNEIIRKFDHSIGTSAANVKLVILNQQLLNIRQNFAEILFAIRIKDYFTVFELSEENLNYLFRKIDQYGKNNNTW